MMRTAIPLSLLMIATMLVPVIATNAPGDNIPEELPVEDILTIDLGPPVFDVARSFMDGREWSTVEMKNALYPPTNGEPSVPVYSHPLKLRNEVIDIQLVRSDPITMPLPDWIPPSPTVVPLTEEFLDSGEASVLDPDLEAYNSDGSFPEEPLLWSSIGWGWNEGERYAHYSVSACPFDYEPSVNRLTYYRNVKLDITLGETQPTLEQLTSEPTRDGTRAVTKPMHVESGTELLVIAYDQFQDELQPYVEWNKEKGTMTTMVPISTVGSTYPSMDQPSSIWQYIHDTYFGDQQELKYVLLAGEVRYVSSRMAKDLDPYAPAGEPSTLPADTYFSCLDGTYMNWNQDADQNWAELNDISDYIPEVFVSRISVDTESEAGNWAQVVVDYEKKVHTTNWAGKAGLFGSSTHVDQDGPAQCEYLWDEYLKGVYQTPERYYSPGSYKDSTGAAPLTYGAINTGLNDGLSIVVYMGHGHRQVWSEGTLDNNDVIYTVNEAASLQQSPKLPFITAMSCETNWFDGTNFESISEGFTENSKGGAIAYVGAVRTTEGGIGYDRYMPGAPGIQEDVLRMMKQGYGRGGEIFHKGKEYYVDSFKNYFVPSYEFAYNAYIEHNMLGAPETPLWTRQPDTFQVNYDFEKDHYTNFTVQVSDSGGNPVEDAVVCVYSSTLDSLSSAITSSNGYVRVPFEITETAYAKITVTKRDFKPYQEEMVILDETPPETTIEATIQNPNGLNGYYTQDPELRFSCSEPAEVYYKWNMGTVNKYKGGFLDIPEGEFTLSFWAVDMSGNEEERNSIPVKFDPNEPKAEITVTPGDPDGEDNWYITRPKVLTDTGDNGGSPEEVKYWYVGGPKETSNGTIYPPEGHSELHLQAVDLAGNKGPEHVLEFRVDTIVPITTLETGGVVPNPRGWYTTPLSLELHCDDRYSTTYYSWDDRSAWERYSSEINPLPGNHTLYFFSEDPHGNKEEVVSRVIAYDIMAPELEVSTEPRSPDGENGWFKSVPKLILDVFNEDNGHTIYYRIGQEQEKEYSSPINIPQGVWNIRCYAEDEAGNRGATHTMEIKVDTETETTRRSVDLSVNNEGWYTEVPGIELETGDGAKVYYRWDSNTEFQRYKGMILPPEEEGEFTLFYYSEDDAGNREKVRTMLVNVDARPPDLKLIAPSSAEKDEAILFDLSGTTDGVGVDSYFVDFGDGSSSEWVEDPNIRHSYSSGGTFTVTVKARDKAGHESEKTFEVEVRDDDSMMIIILIGSLGAGIIIIALVIGFALVIRSRRHHDHVHADHHPVHRAPLGAHLHGGPHPNSLKGGSRNRPNERPPEESSQKKSIPPPPSEPRLPKPPEPPI
ncbi:MAG: C25 family cysteine peptidase [Thermoplasmatota archaeon]